MLNLKLRGRAVKYFIYQKQALWCMLEADLIVAGSGSLWNISSIKHFLKTLTINW